MFFVKFFNNNLKSYLFKTYIVIEIVNNFTNSSLNPIPQSSILCQQEKQLDISAILTLSLISFIAILVLIGTFLDFYEIYLKQLFQNKRKVFYEIIKEEDENLIQPEKIKNSLIIEILQGFSAIKNSKKIFDITNTEGQLECLNGIRFLSIAWVILGHTYSSAASVADNALEIYTKWLPRFSFAIVSNAFYSVDSFFLLRFKITLKYIFVYSF